MLFCFISSTRLKLLPFCHFKNSFETSKSNQKNNAKKISAYDGVTIGWTDLVTAKETRNGERNYVDFILIAVYRRNDRKISSVMAYRCSFFKYLPFVLYWPEKNFIPCIVSRYRGILLLIQQGGHSLIWSHKKSPVTYSTSHSIALSRG